MEDAELTPVTLTCAPWVRDRFIAELPGQLVKQVPLPSGDIEVHALACSLDWLSGWLLGFGTSAVAIEPPELREKVGHEARTLAALYGKSVFTQAS
jgi:predicted DNA-binding transcriptional regulator YafY